MWTLIDEGETGQGITTYAVSVGLGCLVLVNLDAKPAVTFVPGVEIATDPKGGKFLRPMSGYGEVPTSPSLDDD